MDVPSALSQELVDAVKRHLDAGQFKEALELPNDNKYAAALKDNSWDLIPHLINRIDDDTIIRWPAMQRCCEKLLLIVAERANPEEVLLELIEQGEIADNDAKFIAILKPLQMAVIRVDKKQIRSLEWCFNTITTYLEKLETPDEHDFTKNERLLLDCNEDVRRILKIYGELPMFYDNFLNEIVNNRKSINKNATICFLVSLFGKPFCCLDLEYDGKTKSQSRVFAERLFKDLCVVQNDLYMFVDYINNKCHPSVKKNRDGVYEDAPADVFLLNENLSPASLGTIYYLLLVERLSAPFLPQIYSPIYIFQECLALTVFLLKQNHNMMQYKGLHLADVLIDLLSPQTPSSLLNCTENYAFVKALTVVAVYCNTRSIRTEAIKVLRKFFFKFDDKGRHLIVTNVYSTLEFAGMKSYIISLYKEAIVEAFTDDKRIKWFKDNCLPEIFKLFCTLPSGVESDLVELSDCIVGVLNFLLYMVMRDGKNMSGVWSHIKDIRDVFLAQIKEGITLSKAHYELKINDYDENREDVEFNVTVGSSPLDLPVKNKKEVLDSAINALHIIAEILTYLEDRIEHHRIKNNITL